MRKGTIIATCLLNCGMVRRLEDGEAQVRQVFGKEFAGRDFDQWNSDVLESRARLTIASVARRISIRVERLIKDLGV
jgi:hypothetical protein